MYYRKAITIGAGVLCLGSAGVSFAQAPADLTQLKQMLEAQNQQIQALMGKVKNLEGKQNDLKVAMKETNEAVAEQNKKVDKASSLLTLGKGIDGLKLTGDLRLRYEMRDKTIDNNANANGSTGDRARIRDRFRLGGVWTNKAEQWEIGAGLATGNDNNGRSTNQDWGMSNTFAHQNVWLDYAYAKHQWELENGAVLSLSAGQLKDNPQVNTILTWDTDLRPQGAALAYGDWRNKEYSGPFASLGAFEVAYLSNGQVINGSSQQDTIDENVWWIPAQIGYKQVGETGTFMGMVGYQNISNAYRNAAAWYGTTSQDPNNAFGGDNTGYTYNIGEAYLEYAMPMGGFEVKPYAHAAYNFGASGDQSQGVQLPADDAESNDGKLGWLLGLDVKRAKWTATYNYCYVGANAVFGPMRDSDFGETAGLTDTDIQGHVLRLGYNLTANCNIGASYMLLNRIDGGSGNIGSSTQADQAQLLQLDLNYKF